MTVTGKHSSTTTVTKQFHKKAKTRTVSPPSGGKRERSNDEEEPPRRVLQRTQETNNDATEEKKSMDDLVLHDLRSDDEEVLEKALFDLWLATYYVNDEKRAKNQRDFFQLGGHSIVVMIMDEYPHCKDLQERGIKVLMEASYENTELQTAIAKVKGIQAIVNAMKKYPTDQGIIHAGLGALINLTANDEANAELLVKKLDAMPFVIERINASMHDEEVIERACGLLTILCAFRNLRKPILAAKALSALAQAIEHHHNNGDIHSSARKAMTKLMTRE